ncbi:CRISPR/Cas system-associated RAMP superfamily protein Cas7 [Serpentinimonas raichei]|uniref:CRISPR/Cas system-associated RAMP superfamily protein Cas7 n=1 Tax=Serpentinimonas raichei TaxID=1458425 RepID=A0A060NIC0_9BURK|nr:type I-E CRISPR-associated protein Cas7/Cse4/CasC [Serpentinimonas raichei]BAO81052.1 CRISPR/Cas system-associated RAMP superfamily protein Cas7 [Serpentinimonas raichei]
MTTKNFINFHVLISHSPSCLNRDDMNMQKTAVFGGVNRVRVSSQSLKRAMRTSAYYGRHLGEPSVRTRNLPRLQARFTEALKDRYDAARVAQTLEWMSGKEGIAGGTGSDAVAPWTLEEVAHYCKLLGEEGQDLKKLEKQIEKDARSFRAAMAQAVDIALSGRMATSGLMSNLPVDGAMAIAHAITTHAVEPQDVDWFTAVDDLTQDAGETGAGHLDTQQFSSGVFYRYASLNLKQLQVNLGLIADMKSEETAESRAQALAVARHVLHLLATVVPSAKQQSFAAHNLADFAVASFADQPISLANAFEEPIKRDRNGGFLKPSIAALAAYWARINAAYGLDENARAFAVQGDVELNGKPAATLAELESWVASGGQG